MGMMLSLIYLGDLGNHVIDSGKSARDTSGINYVASHTGCSSASKEAISHLSNNNDYISDGTQMEKVIIIIF